MGMNPEWTQPQMDSTLNGLKPWMDQLRMGLNIE